MGVNTDDIASTERSPLLIKPHGTAPSTALASEEALESADTGTIPDDDEEAQDHSHSTPVEQYEGLPEVKKRLKYIFPAVAIGVFLSAADQTIIVSTYGKIGSELNALSQTSWIATAYFLTLTSWQPLYGKLSDMFGRKPCLLFGYTIFGLGCLGCGLAADINQLIAARAFAGIGGGAMTTVVSVLFSDICTLRERGQYQGYINIIFAAGASTGAPLGGVMADYVGWRWAFLIQVPLCALAFVAVAFALHLPQHKDSATPWWKRLRQVDFPGATVLICAVFTLLLGLDNGSNHSWRSTWTLASLGGSAILWIAFVVVETRIASEPFAPGHVIFNRTMVACFACNFFAMAGWLSTIFYIPLYFQTIDHVSATGAGLRLIPSVVLGVVGSLFAGAYMRRTGKYYWITVAAYTGLTLGLIAVFLFSGPITDSTVGIILGMCLAGFGNGNGITTTLIGLIANASRDDQAIATACSYLFRSLGSTFGVSMSATVANIRLRQLLASRLPALGLPEDDAVKIAERVRESLAFVRTLQPKIRVVVEECFAQSTNAAFGLQIAFCLGAAISAFFIRETVLSA